MTKKKQFSHYIKLLNKILFILISLSLIISCRSAYKFIPEKNADLYSRNCTSIDHSIFDKGIKKLSKLIEKNSSNSLAYSTRGYSYLMTNRLNKALLDYNKAIEKSPSFSNYLERSVVNKKLENFENEYKDFKKAEALYSKELNHSFQFGTYYLSQRQYQKALNYFEKAVTEDKIDSSIPLLFSIYANIGFCNYKLGRFDEALEYYNTAEKIYSNSSSFYVNIGLNYEALELSNNAIDSYTIAIKLDPKYFVPRYNRGNANFSPKNYDKAIVDFKIAETLTNRSDYLEIINCNLARLMFLTKNYDKSIYYGEKVLLNKDIDKPDKFYCIAKFNMAISYLNLSKPKIAYSLYSECFKNNGLSDSPDLIEELRDDLIDHYKSGLDQKIVKEILIDIVKITDEELDTLLKNNL